MKSHLGTQVIRALQRKVTGRVRTLNERYPEYKIGAGSYGDLKVLEWGEGASLSIGAYTSIGTAVQVFLGGEHRTDWVTTFPFSTLWESAQAIKGHPRSKGDVAIGNDVWIANEVVIMSGVTVGDGAVIGARSVVTKDVPAYAIVAGNPARIARFRFDRVTIERLLRIKWWDWEPSRIANSMAAMLNADIESFLSAAEAGKL